MTEDAMAVQNYRDLVVWQRAMDLAEAIYGISRGFPKEELYGLTNQVRRAAVSVPSNIAEGQGRGSTREFVQFLHIANGSRQELETQLILAQRLNYIREQELEPLLALSEEVGRIRSGLL